MTEGNIVYTFFEDGTDTCPETSVEDYHLTLRNIPAKRRSQLYFLLVKEFAFDLGRYLMAS
jgi:hypothetical protein